MEKSNLTPYCINLPADQIKMIKNKAGDRMASAFIRDAISSALASDSFSAGYNKAVGDACTLVQACQDIDGLSIHGQTISDLICDRIGGLTK